MSEEVKNNNSNNTQDFNNNATRTYNNYNNSNYNSSRGYSNYRNNNLSANGTNNSADSNTNSANGTNNTDGSNTNSNTNATSMNNFNNFRNRRAKKKVCSFCVDRTLTYIDYKEPGRLRKFISERAKILPRRVTGTCAEHQRQLTVAIKRARYVALLPYTND